ncbi:unnamed protein product [Linum tenue]|uniref:Zinc finger MYM-type protein 1-like n=2 Tax=Linum tenue TaxID=586396 RepID=A0AAV0RXL6_9ROSI|nr:unnamed protein product [Linum tenue]
MKQSQSIAAALSKQSDQSKIDYRIRLEASIDCVTFLIRNGMALRGHDESEDSDNRGNFLELLEFHARGREIIQRVVLENAPRNLQLISPDIQKDIVRALAMEITKEILKDLGDGFFAILVDEARDVSIKEQMAVVIRYVDGGGYVVERFLGISHVKDTRALTLKNEVESLLIKHGLSLSRLRGQGYDGASNMSGQLNGLKTLILDENSSAYYVHCFAHQLQLTLVAVAKNHGDISLFFGAVSSLITLVGGSCKRLEFVRNAQLNKVARALSYGELETGRGLNQETSLKRPCDTRWGSHFGTLVNLEFMYSAVIAALDDVQRDGNGEAKGEAIRMLNQLDTFDFAFMLKLMIHVLAITNELSLALQRKDQDIVNAVHLVSVAKYRLQQMRDSRWDSLLASVVSFCVQEGIEVPDMNGQYVPPGRSRRRGQQVSNLHYFQVEVFYTVIDMQLQELNIRFNEANSQLLSCMACLSPYKSFAAFDLEKVIHLASFYPKEFSSRDINFLRLQMDSFIGEVQRDERFKDLKGVDELAIKMVETFKHNQYPLVYLLIKLTLILPVATASVERSFSAMTYIKNKFRNRISDD